MPPLFLLRPVAAGAVLGLITIASRSLSSRQRSFNPSLKQCTRTSRPKAKVRRRRPLRQAPSLRRRCSVRRLPPFLPCQRQWRAAWQRSRRAGARAAGKDTGRNRTANSLNTSRRCRCSKRTLRVRWRHKHLILAPPPLSHPGQGQVLLVTMMPGKCHTEPLSPLTRSLRSRTRSKFPKSQLARLFVALWLYSRFVRCVWLLNLRASKFSVQRLKFAFCVTCRCQLLPHTSAAAHWRLSCVRCTSPFRGVARTHYCLLCPISSRVSNRTP